MSKPAGDAGLQPDELIALGRITRTQGNTGDVRMFPYFEPPEEFERLRNNELILTPAPPTGVRPPPLSTISPSLFKVVHVIGHYYHKQFVILRLAEVSNMTEAEAFRNLEVLVRPQTLWIPAEGSFFAHELVGFRLVDADSGAVLGEVEGIAPGAAHDFIRVKAGTREFLVPFSKAIVSRVSTGDGQIYVTLPLGLDEL